MILLTRVDHRLLHGQVAVSWVQGLQANCIFCVGDRVANDPIWKMTLKMGKPADCKLVIKDMAHAIEAINSGSFVCRPLQKPSSLLTAVHRSQVSIWAIPREAQLRVKLRVRFSLNLKRRRSSTSCLIRGWRWRYDPLLTIPRLISKMSLVGSPA